MSSGAFSIELQPSNALRGMLVVCAIVSTVTGVVLILLLPIDGGLRSVLAIAWSCAGARDVRARLAGAGQLNRIRLTATGEVHALDVDANWRRVTILPGSLVTGRFAWLRLRLADGSSYAELLTGDARQSRDWHGLQLVWRLRREVFGGQRLS